MDQKAKYTQTKESAEEIKGFIFLRINRCKKALAHFELWTVHYPLGNICKNKTFISIINGVYI